MSHYDDWHSRNTSQYTYFVIYNICMDSSINNNYFALTVLLDFL
jgi:hypothetical protein